MENNSPPHSLRLALKFANELGEQEKLFARLARRAMTADEGAKTTTTTATIHRGRRRYASNCNYLSPSLATKKAHWLACRKSTAPLLSGGKI